MAARHEVRTFLTLDGRQWKREMARARRDLTQFRKSANVAMTRAGIAFAATTVLAAKIGSGFEQSMANISAVTGKTGKDLKKLEATARQLGKTTSFSATQASDALLTLSKAGLKTEESIAAVDAVLKFAGASSVAMGEAAEFAVGTMKSFGKTAEDTEAIVNVLFATTTRTQAGFEDLKEAMKLAAPVVGTMGLTLEDTAASLGIMADQNFRGSIAATALNAAILALNDPSKDLKALLGGVSLEADGLAGVLDKLKSESFDVRDAFKSTFFGIRGGKAIAILMNQGADSLRNLTAGITGTEAAMKAYEIQQDTTTGAFLRMKSALEEVAIKFFQTFQEDAKESLDAAAKWVNDNGEKISRALGKMVDAVIEVAKQFGRFIGFLKDHSRAIGFFAKVVGTATVAIYAIATAQAAWNVVSNLNPVILIITGVIALGVAINELVQWYGGWGEAIGDLMLSWKILENMTVAGLQVMWAATEFVIRGILGGMKRLNDTAIEFGRQLGRMLNPATFRDAAQKMKDAVTGTFDGWWDGLTDNFRKQMTAIDLAYNEKIVALNKVPPPKIVPELPSDEEMEAAGAKAGAAAAKGLKSGMGGGGAAPLFDPSLMVRDTSVVPLLDDAGNAFGDGGRLGPVSLDAEKMKEFERLFGESNQRLFDMQEQSLRGMSRLYDDFWRTTADMDMTGKQRREAIWQSFGHQVHKIIGDTVKAALFGDKIILGSTEKTEAGKAAAMLKGGAIRIGSMLKEFAISVKTGVVNLWHATTGFFKAHAGIPFAGAAIAAGAVAGMFALASKAKAQSFAKGGLVDDGPSGVDNVPAFVSRGEYIMPVEQTRMFRPMLEAMRAGRPFLAAGNSTGGLTVNVDVSIAEGSLFLAEDDFSVVRFAEAIHNIIENRIKRGFQDA